MTRTVVVVSLRAGDWLADCLQSASEQADQLIVVDNGSQDAEVSSTGRAFGATTVRSEVNQGFAGGVNEGLRRATGDIVALLNDDAVAGRSWLDTAEAALSSPSVGAVTPKVVLQPWYAQIVASGEPWFADGDTRPLGRKLTSVRVGDNECLGALVGPGIHRLESGGEGEGTATWRWTRPGKPFFVPLDGYQADGAVTVNGEETVTFGPACRLINNAGLYLRTDGYAGDHGLEAPDDGRFDHQRELFGVSGTAMVMTADVLHKVGLFAEPLFAYYEDTDWSWRARRLGLRLLYTPDATVSHRRSVTSQQTLGPRVQLLGERNRLLCLVRNAPRPVAGREVNRRIMDGPGLGIRRQMLKLLPWAVATRIGLDRRSTVSGHEVWAEWAGADVVWDDGPCRPNVGGP